jgi:histone deacetylase 1/2
MRITGKIARLLQEVDPDAKKHVQEDGSILVEIRRSLYGLPEAAQLWYDYLSKALLDGGYKKCPNEPCLFKRTIKNNNGRIKISIVSIYVDDCLHICNDPSIERELYASLRNANLKDLKIADLSSGNDISFLGLNLSVHKDGETIVLHVDQSGYLQSLLDMYEEELSKLRDAVTPCDENVFKPIDEGDMAETINITEFMSKLMRVRYLVRTRPDIELAISALTTKSRAPTKGDMKRLNRVLCYLRGTKTICIIIRPVEDLKIYAYMDAGYAVHPKMESHSGVIVTMGKFGPPIHYKSLKQKLVTTSSTEAELVAIYDALDFIIWMREIMDFLGWPQGTTTIFQDNTSTICMAHMGRGSAGSHTRHIKLRYFWIKQFIDDKTFSIEHLPTDNMIADFFASPRMGQFYRKMRDMVMGRVL